jgi:hypothetical protein
MGGGNYKATTNQKAKGKSQKAKISALSRGKNDCLLKRRKSKGKTECLLIGGYTAAGDLRGVNGGKWLIKRGIFRWLGGHC